ncbi:MAG: TonB-dependent receptor, partial [Gammaproteobacteria bacterium]
VLDHFLGGWGVNGIYTYMSGEPFSVRSGVRTSNFSHESRAALVGAKPEVKLQEIAGIIGPVVFRDASAFTVPVPGTNGAGRNIFEAPGYWNLDLGIQKKFSITERTKLQFRMEMFNALNHPNFDNPRDASVGSPSFRSTVFAQTCCATVAPPTTQTIIQTGESARVIQFALKVLF